MILAVALAWFVAQGDLELPTRVPIAHLAGFETTSSVRFAAKPDVVHRLVATHVFPARVRLLMTLPSEASLLRTIYYRAGTQWFTHDAGSAVSRQLEADEVAELEPMFALREALVLWPNGCAWQGTGEARRARIGDNAQLIATVGPEALPRKLAWVDAQGEEVESLREIVWRTAGNRTLPASFSLVQRGELTCRETVESVEFEVAYVDDFFTPLDRHADDPSGERSVRCERVDVPARFVQQLPIAVDGVGSDWRALSARVLAARDKLARDPSTLGLKLDRGAEVELDATAKPVACFARLAEESGGQHDAWKRRVGVRALSLRFVPEQLSVSSALAQLVERVPRGVRAGVPYVRLAGGTSGEGMQLVLPLLPL